MKFVNYWDMRNTRELLEVLLEAVIQEVEFFGMCDTLREMTGYDLDEYENSKLKDYINNNFPKGLKQTHDTEINRMIGTKDWYWWEYGDKRPRIKWLEKHIQLNS